ncbi:hypothetical protein EUTSA_v10026790mg [Eutrema salsugineum]|uniref:F-box domain-containing protein n=2 Tax=Eutrema salsugineum TaxID=72664 RepID=V4MP12_EUTSA|nr:hypothetical protein EUTSA_v10026790mg [Eutrema salsugineum]
MKSKERDDKDFISLPVELIIEILTKLPPRSLSKLICVSKLWSSIIQGKYFTDLYLTRSSTRPRLLFHRYCFDTRLSHYSSLENPSFVHSITLPGYQISPPVRGLICCRDHDSNAAIGNPSTGQFLTLPKVERSWLNGIFLGYDPVDDLYKVLSMIVVLQDKHGYQGQRCQVLTLGAQESWRTIECKYPYYALTQGICQNGVIYYGACPDIGDRYVLVSFDLRLEEFSLITLPEGVHVSGYPPESDLVSYNGKIALANHSPSPKFDLWVLMDVNKQEWTQISFVVPCWEDSEGNAKFRFNVLRWPWEDKMRCRGTISTGELIIEPRDNPYQFSLLYYNPKEDKARRVDLERSGDRCIHRITFLDHIESPMFLPRKFIS